MPSAPTCPVLEFRTPLFHPGCNTSVRRGRRWHGVSEARVRLPNGELSPPLPLHTELRQFSSLDGNDLRGEHDPNCRTAAGLLAELQRIYPGFTAQEEVTLVHFTL